MFLQIHVDFGEMRHIRTQEDSRTVLFAGE